MSKREQLNQRIRDISHDIKRRVAAFQDDHPMQMTARLAELQEALGELAEIATRRIIVLTWILSGLTAALLWYTIKLYQIESAKHENGTLPNNHQLQNPQLPKVGVIQIN